MKKQTIIILVFAFFVSCNKIPNTPVCLYPTDGATNVIDKNIVLEWSATDPDNDILVYDLRFAEDTLNGILINEHTITQNYDKTTYVLTELKDTTNYIWSVKAIDPKGNSSMKMFSFKTGFIER